MFFGSRGFHNEIFHRLVYSLVKIHVHKDSLYCTTMLLLENIFINLFNYLLNCLAVHIGTCLDVTNFVPRDMVINNGALFTNIKSDKKLQTYVI